MVLATRALKGRELVEFSAREAISEKRNRTLPPYTKALPAKTISRQAASARRSSIPQQRWPPPSPPPPPHRPTPHAHALLNKGHAKREAERTLKDHGRRERRGSVICRSRILYTPQVSLAQCAAATGLTVTSLLPPSLPPPAPLSTTLHSTYPTGKERQDS